MGQFLSQTRSEQIIFFASPHQILSLSLHPDGGRGMRKQQCFKFHCVADRTFPKHEYLISRRCAETSQEGLCQV